MPCREKEGQVHELICDVRLQAYSTNDSKYLAFYGVSMRTELLLRDELSQERYRQCDVV